MSFGPAFQQGSGGGAKGDPCTQYATVQCGSPSNTLSDYAPYFADPRTLRDANGCFMFNGCYLSWGGQHFYWNGQISGYVLTYPQTNAPVQTAPGAGQYNPPSGLSSGTPAQQTYQYAPGAGAPSGPITVNTPALDLTPLNNIAQGFTNVLQEINRETLGLGQTLAQGLIAGNGPLTQAIRDLIVKVSGQPQGAIPDITEISRILNNAVQAIADASQQQARDNVGITKDFVAGLAQQVQAVNQQVLDNLKAAQGGGTPEAKAFQASGTKAFDDLSNLLQQLSGQGGNDLTGLITHVLTQGLADLPLEIGKRLQAYKLLFDYLLQGKFNSWGELESALHALSGTNDLGFFLIDLFAIATIVLRLGVIRAEPIAVELQQLSNADHPVKVLDQGALVEAKRRGEIGQAEFAHSLALHGLDNDKALLLAKLSETLPGVTLLEPAVLRGFMDAGVAQAYLEKEGYSPDVVKATLQLFEHIPGPSDLTRIADKRVWSQHTDPKYGQYAELPTELIDYLAQWGFDKKWAEWLWAAHWNLPSPPQIYDMLHREEITESDIDTYLGLTDWLPFFRDKLKAISYLTLGRIDIKRAHNAGIIDDATALKKYKHLGNTDENAKILLEISKQSGHDNADHLIQQLRDRARTAVEKAYTKGTINAAEAEEHLVALGIPSATAQALIALLDHEIAVAGQTSRRESHQTKVLNMVIHAFSKGTIPYDDAVSLLNNAGITRAEAINELLFAEIERNAELKSEWATHAIKLYSEHTIEYDGFGKMLAEQGFSLTEIEQLAQEAIMKRQQRAKKPTEADLKALVKKKIITANQYADELRGLGLAEKYVEWLVSLAIAG